jgi:hypothetical protein
LVGVRVFDAANQAAELDLLLFGSAPADAGDNNAFVLSAADLGKLVVAATVVAADYNVVATRAYAMKEVGTVGQLPKTTVAGTGEAWLAVVTQGTPTYTLGALRIQLVLEEE